MSEHNKYAVTTQDSEEQSGGKWIEACTLQEVTITGVKYITSSQKGTPGIEIEVRNDDASDKAQKCVQNFWLSEKAFDITKRILANMALKAGTLEEFTKLSSAATSDESFVEAAKKALVGKRMWMLFAGEQQWIENKIDGIGQGTFNLWIKSTLNPYKFCAAIGDEAKKAELQNILDTKKDRMVKETPKPVETTGSASGGEVSWG